MGSHGTIFLLFGTGYKSFSKRPFFLISSPFIFTYPTGHWCSVHGRFLPRFDYTAYVDAIHRGERKKSSHPRTPFFFLLPPELCIPSILSTPNTFGRPSSDILVPSMPFLFKCSLLGLIPLPWIQPLPSIYPPYTFLLSYTLYGFSSPTNTRTAQ